jgi:translation initiation factor 1 (eIF-1/SUI1)
VQLKALRVANKKVTTITGLELFQIDYEELLPFLSHKCAGSATIFETIEGQKKDSFTVQVQG